MIGVGAVYLLTGLMFAGVAILSARDRTNPKRWRNTAFWGLFALGLLFGDLLGDFANGGLVIAMVSIAAFGGLGRGSWRPRRPRRVRRRRCGSGIASSFPP